GELEQVARIDRIGRSRSDRERHPDSLVGVDLCERSAQLLERLQHGVVSHRSATAAEDRALQLVLDDGLHAVQLWLEGSRCRLSALQEAANCREWRLQAVREVPERRAVALEPLALADEERVEIARDAGQFARPTRSERFTATGLDVRDL